MDPFSIHKPPDAITVLIPFEFMFTVHTYAIAAVVPESTAKLSRTVKAAMLVVVNVIRAEHHSVMVGKSISSSSSCVT